MIYLFKTHYSLQGRSIIQVNDLSKEPKEGPPNLVDLCVKYKVNPCVVVEDSMAGFWQIYKSLSQANIQMIFGLRLSFVDNAADKESHNPHKNIIFVKNPQGYKTLIKISSIANTDFFHQGEGRVDYNFIHSLWSDDLVMGIPFYDSFLYKNLFTLNTCVPDYRDIKPTVFWESHEKPHDKILLKSCTNYAKENGLELQEARSIYYENRQDFLAWKARKVMANSNHGKENTLMNANLNHCSSDTFCLDIA